MEGPADSSFNPANQIWQKRLKLKDKELMQTRSVFTSLSYELAAFPFLLLGVHSLGQASSGPRVVCGTHEFDIHWKKIRNCSLVSISIGSKKESDQLFHQWMRWVSLQLLVV